MALEGYKVQTISYQLAMFYIIQKHYLHRKASCTHAFALYKDHEIKGVITYGTPSSPTLRDGVCGKEYTNDVIELTRLWVCDSVPRNGESFLIGNTLKRLDKDIVVSYADESEGHVGRIYQATNWIYTGLSAKGFNWSVEGLDAHNTSLLDRFDGDIDKIREEYGDAFQLVPRSRKHRYVYLLGDRRRRKELQNAMKYKILPYPKDVKEKESKLEQQPQLNSFFHD
jgi:hypothetical protein